ncbi:MAG: translation initiation factor IF-2 [Bacteroidetes bacterium]|nr:translation initiation factor IF-2 [Bacteroidota bacterium]
MAENKPTRLSKIAREFNVGIATIVDFLHNKGVKVESNPNTKISAEHYELLHQEFSSDINAKKESEKLDLKRFRSKNESVSINDVPEEEETEEQESLDELMIKDPKAKKVYEPESEKEYLKSKEPKLKVVGKIDVNKKEEKDDEEEVKEVKEETEEKPETEEKEPVENIPEEPSEEQPTEVPEENKEVIDIDEIEQEEEDSEISHLGDYKSDVDVRVLGKIDLSTMNQRTRPKRKTKEEKEAERKARVESQRKKGGEKQKQTGEEEEPNKEFIETDVEKLSGPKVVGKIDVNQQKEEDKNKKNLVASSSENFEGDTKKKKRKRIVKDKEKVDYSKDANKGQRQDNKRAHKKDKRRKRPLHPDVNEEDVQKQVKDTLARLTQKSKSKSVKYRREKREAISQKMQEEVEKQEEEKNTLKVTEFVSVNELASMMNVTVTDVISSCMNLGLFVSINQRLDAETMSLVADEFNYKVEFISPEVQESIEEEEDSEDLKEPRSPIVTVMGHVDHGKTKLLDYVRKANVIAGEAGGITQHIGAYAVELEDKRRITFLDTPGHEAFTAMRARGAQITDVAIIVVAADDGVKPQTIEAVNHAHAAGVPIVFAINKMDKPTANPDKVKEELANMNFMVEDWGGKYQSQEISAINGNNVEDLLEKVLLEAELLDLKANPKKSATGTVIESSLDKGRGYIATVLVQTGTMHVGDIILAGSHSGHVKAMFNERNKRIEAAGPSTPVLILGLDGAPQAGDRFNIMESDKEAKDIANKRAQLQREQEQRTKKHITLDEIGRRIAIGNFQELNLVVKGDVDGSVEALSDSLIKLSNEEIQVNIIHKAVGQISESDILLAAASNAIVLGFQVRPSGGARRLAEKEQIDIRMYSIIYDAIEEVKSAMEGMLSPEIKEEMVGTAEIRETFKITKVGTIAGCLVTEGKIVRDAKVRVIRDGIVTYTGNLGSLKRFKDDVKEAVSGQECGLNIENFNDIKVGDVIEAFREFEVKKKLE